MRSPVQAVDANAKPALALQPEQISPALALMELAGDPPDALARQALAAGHADTAFAIAVYGVDIAPPVRRALLQQAAGQFAPARPVEAAMAVQAAQAITRLSPELSVAERHQALLAAAATFLSIDAAQAAQDALAQALVSAAQTPGLLPAQRVETFEAVRSTARDAVAQGAASQSAAAETLAAQAAEYARNPFLNPAGQLLTPQFVARVHPGEPDPAVLQAVEQRQFAARILAERIQLTGGIDIEPEQQALAAALVAEDAVRGDAYRTAQATPSLTPNARLWFHLERLAWLTQKARIAHGGYGLALVPEWEPNAEFILQDLSTVYHNINVQVTAISNEIADPVTQNHLRLEVLRQLAQAWELGLHPAGLPTDLGERMRVVQDELARSGQPLALPIYYSESATPPGFRMGQP